MGFIIENCPAYRHPYCYNQGNNSIIACAEINYCLLKQIFNACDDEALNCEYNHPCSECGEEGCCSSEFANRLLKKMQFERLEETL